MKITIHAVERFNQRVLNNDEKIHVNSIRSRLIQRKIRNCIAEKVKQFSTEGFYRVEDDIFALVMNKTVITIVKSSHTNDFYLNNKMIEKQKQDALNCSANQKQRFRKYRRNLVKPLTPAFTKDSQRIDELLELDRENMKKRRQCA